MPWIYPYLDDIDLFVKAKISEKDAIRQEKTSKAILEKLTNQPGIILADEVGMGKTFVSLAVAVSVAISDKKKRPVIIMVPAAILNKWVRDFGVFKEKCLPVHHNQILQSGKAENVVELLKLLGDNASKSKRIIFLKNGAFNHNMKDKWIRLAIIKRTLFNRKKNMAGIYRSLERFGPELLEFKIEERRSPGLIKKLLRNDLTEWKKILSHTGSLNKSVDDPIPKQLIEVLESMKTVEFDALLNIVKLVNPRSNLLKIRTSLKVEINNIWQICLKRSKQSLPLLILDEAHHLKNARSRFASLFHSETEDLESTYQSKGGLEGIFERMLFLTATPFQLGHYELCNVLDRFTGIDWNKQNRDIIKKEPYILEVKLLRNALDETQRAALGFNEVWGKLGPDDLYHNANKCLSVNDWWNLINNGEPVEKLNTQLQLLIHRFVLLKHKIKQSEALLKKYIIRHIRDKYLYTDSDEILRRDIISGDGITKGILGNIDEKANKDNTVKGLQVSQNSLLPFLLAARISSLNPETRPVFAEGLASSYDAFMDTRKNKIKSQQATQIVDEDDSPIIIEQANYNTSKWYFEQIDAHFKSPMSKKSHPKIKATVEKAIDLWMRGEKVLIFCHYISTTKALKRELSFHLQKQIEKEGYQKLKHIPGSVTEAFNRISNSIDAPDSLLRKAFDKKVNLLLKDYPELIDASELILNVLRRYFKTPSFLVRFYPLGQTKKPHQIIELAFEKKDHSGLTFHNVIEGFFHFLAIRCGSEERNIYLTSLKSIQTGIVREVTGSTEKHTRENLMLSFNTPFAPEILIASSVMAEGVDLHLNCRHIIHHDLSWNPSTLEQRTGRIDRIGGKVERCKLPIQIYFPFIADTQDEKMYKVVMYRNRWFNILMGEEYQDDYESTEKIADRLPLPDEIVKDLTLDLKV